MNPKLYQWALVLACAVVAGCSSSGETVQPVTYEKKAVTNEWVMAKEIQLKESIKNTDFTLQRFENGWLVTAPAQQSFNADRPSLLLPVVLRPITQIAKLLESSPDSAVLILSHTNQLSDDKANYQLSTDRAKAVASIFRLSGLGNRRMKHLGMGSSYALNTLRHSAQNQRVEMFIMPDTHMHDVLAEYQPAYNRQLALSQAQ